MNTDPSNSTDCDARARNLAHRRALAFGVVAIFFTVCTIPAQSGLFVTGSVLFYLSVASAVVGGVFWIAALCIVTQARGYNPLWGLLLLFPPLILIYPFVFPDKNLR